MDTMTAAFFRSYGKSDVIEVGPLAGPSCDGPRLRIAVHAAGVNPRDTLLRSGYAMYPGTAGRLARFVAGRAFPKVTGSDFSGTVLEVGREDAGVAVGDAVFGYVQGVGTGSAAEQLVVPSGWWARKPAGLAHATAAALPCAYLAALQGLRDAADIQPGQHLLVYGASGGVGTAALQLGRHLGAEITAVTSDRNADFCLAQGAHHVLRYDGQDLWAERGRYDVFFQVHSPASLYERAKPLIKPRGIFVGLIPLPGLFAKGLWLRLTRGPQLRPVMVQVRRAALEELGRLAVAGVVRPQVQTMPLADARRAHDQLDTGHTRGKIVLTVRDEAA